MNFLARSIFFVIALHLALQPSYVIAIELTPKQLYEQVSNSVVVITGKSGDRAMQGSGVAYISGYSESRSSSFTYILTNAHVVAELSEITVSTANNTKFKSYAKRVDQALDLAFLRIDGVSLPTVKGRNESGSHLVVGDKVFAVGSPIGMANSLSEGIVSGLRIRQNVSLIQTTAPISRGSSGGGLFDAQGNLVGITTFKLIAGENINFAVDLKHVRALFAAQSERVQSPGVAAPLDNKEEVAKQMDRLEPNWRAIVASKEFRQWMSQLPKSERDKLDESWDPLFIHEKIKAFQRQQPAGILRLVCRYRDVETNGEVESVLVVDLTKRTINERESEISDDEFVFKISIKGVENKMIINRYTGFVSIASDKWGIFARGACAKAAGVKF